MNHTKSIFIIVLLLVSFSMYQQTLNAQNISNDNPTDQSIKLLIRMDDMGNSYGRTKGIIKAYKSGLIASTSIMPTSQFFEESVQLCKENPGLVVGIHITLLGTRVRSVLSPEIVPSLLTPEGFFYESLDELMNANPKPEEMEKEIRAQIGKVRASGLNFVYLDWHRSVPEAAEKFIDKLCHEQQLVFGQDYKRKDESEYGYTLIPLMPESWPSQKLPDGQLVHYAAPAFNNEQQQSFFDGLSDLKPGRWMIMVHPGLGEPQRNSVAEILCSPKFKEILKMKNIQLVSYSDLWEEEYGNSNNR